MYEQELDRGGGDFFVTFEDSGRNNKYTERRMKGL